VHLAGAAGAGRTAPATRHLPPRGWHDQRLGAKALLDEAPPAGAAPVLRQVVKLNQRVPLAGYQSGCRLRRAGRPSPSDWVVRCPLQYLVEGVEHDEPSVVLADSTLGDELGTRFYTGHVPAGKDKRN